MVQAMETRRKKDLGAFYTHQGLSDLICSWAIVSSESTVLEPSFGGCGFLRSARDRLVAIGSNTSFNQLYGSDIDPQAFSHLSNVFERPVDMERFHEGDFLDQDFPSSWPKAFDAVVGNPPYLPYQKISIRQRELVLEQLQKFGLRLDRRASLWAYFVALSVPYTATGGRAAWVLPSSFLYANYSAGLRSFIAENFENVRAFELKERQFLLEGTEEKTIVLLCKGKLKARRAVHQMDIPLDQCEGVKDLRKAVQIWEVGKTKVKSYCATSVFDSLSDSPKKLMKRLQKGKYCQTLNDYLGIKIGLVTGNNAFFLLSENDRKDIGLAKKELRRILPRFHFTQGLHFDSSDHDTLLAGGGKGFLISEQNPSAASVEINAYLDQYSEEDIDNCSTFKKRTIWSKTEDDSPPDAFFPVIQHHGPRLVLNRSGFNCTNSVHRAYFRKRFTQSQKQLISLSLISTFSQISAEICGRSYGSGALKHEPREAERIEILMPELHHKTIGSVYTRVDRLLRKGNHEEARQQVDHLILTALDTENVSVNAAMLRSGLDQLKFHRHR